MHYSFGAKVTARPTLLPAQVDRCKDSAVSPRAARTPYAPDIRRDVGDVQRRQKWMPSSPLLEIVYHMGGTKKRDRLLDLAAGWRASRRGLNPCYPEGDDFRIQSITISGARGR
jgi:hypothetical protein